MKNYITAFIIVMGLLAVNAQKVKGNRDVTTQIINVDEFNTINIGEDMEVVLSQGSSSKVDITVDSNLHQYIDAKVVGGVLSIRSTTDIRRRKELKINIVYTSGLQNIIAFGDAQISSMTDLRMENLQVDVKDNAKMYLTGRVENLVYNSMSDSKSECNLSGDKAQLNFNGDSNTEALLNYDELTFDMKDKAGAKIEGDAKEVNMKLEGRSNLIANKLDIKDLVINISRNATASINVSRDLEVRAKDDAEIELYNNPKINMAEFSGKAALMKR